MGKKGKRGGRSPDRSGSEMPKKGKQRSLFGKDTKRSTTTGDNTLSTLEDSWTKKTSDSGTLPPKSSCDHRGQNRICTLQRGITLAGAKGHDIDFSEADLVLDCAGLTKTAFNAGGKGVISGTQSLVDQLLPLFVHPDTLFLDWPDMGIPRVGPKFWSKLLEIAPDNTRLVACCMGSHGRTGTALACLIVANAAAEKDPITDATAVIKLVRRSHCGYAIESQAQEDYICRMVASYLAPGSKEEVNKQYALLDAYNKTHKKAKAALTPVATPAAGAQTFGPSKPYKAPAGYVHDLRSKPGTLISPAGTVVTPPNGTHLFPDDDPDGDLPPGEFAALAAAMNLDGGGIKQSQGSSSDISGWDQGDMFVDAGGNVVDSDGVIVVAKNKMNDTQKSHSKTLPSWGEYIAKKYQNTNAVDTKGK